ncbi:hypothetical protein BKP45_09415 [Anaerobacillus alkalidiazotrophicus]|uniref:Type II secretion system protein GspF domain-containing protein n=1 Tax=Anaerobacillus alkalidiazotrophicus TaxID=472963 RepID=A0A1S2M6K6_9BACI|nr:competence type IV pilus assembly protein ComGB [Anaerobacillus alkalidiazotrophicus]OIJ20274.1 hypothetical protein BKP45_09415 [Anaerobacillus alkalidiazotrophicus]
MRKKNWNNDEKADFLIRIGGLLDQGYTISETLELFLKYDKEKLKPMMYQLLEELKNGRSFSDALLVLEIPEHIISFVHFAENYGNLSSGLQEGGNLLRKTDENKRKLQKLFKYPIFLLWILIIFFVIIYKFLFPQFALLFSTLNISLPLITRLFMFTLENTPTFFLLFLIIMSTCSIYFVAFFNKKSVFEKARFIAKLPLIGNFYKMISTYFFTTNLSYLIKNGMSIYDALNLFKDQKKLGYISIVATAIISKLEKGQTLHQALLSEPLFLKGLAFIVDHGQSSGRLDSELNYYGRWVLLDFEEKLKRIFMIIQPTLFVFIGLIILFMFTSIMLPIYTLMKDF